MSDFARTGRDVRPVLVHLDIAGNARPLQISARTVGRSGKDRFVRASLKPEGKPMTAFGDYQNEIYFKGLRGLKPKLPVNFKLLELKARAAMPETVLSYIAGGCGDERTQEHNIAAFDRWGLIPRMMV